MKYTIVALSVLLVGCSGNPEYSYIGDSRINMAGASQLFPHAEFVTIDLARQIADDKKLQKWEHDNGFYLYGYTVETAEHQRGRKVEKAVNYKPILTDKNLHCEQNSDPGSKPCILARARLDYAFDLYSKNDQHTQQQIRNELQDRIIAASEQRCNVYRMYLKRTESRNNFMLGTLTTVLGGAGALFTNQVGNRILSGLAGITSGVRAEFNQAYLASQAAQVITKGITARRNELRTKLNARRSENTTQYTLQAAIADAIHYHGACNILTGLEAAESAIERVENPGLDLMTKSLYKSRHVEEILQGKTPEQFKFQSFSESKSTQPEKTMALQFDTKLATLGSNLVQAFYAKAEERPHLKALLLTLKDEKTAASKKWIEAINEKYVDYLNKIQNAYTEELDNLNSYTDEQDILASQLRLKALETQLLAQQKLVLHQLEAFNTALDSVTTNTKSLAPTYQYLFDFLPTFP